MTLPALEITGLQASENHSPVLHGVDLRVGTGEAVALLGHNGAELSATLRAVLGHNPARQGSVLIHGVESIALDAHAVSHLGVAACPARPDIVAGMTCEENLLLPLPLEGVLGGGLSLTDIYELFPELRRSRTAPGVHLNEAEQQMLAIARVLRSGANLLLFDQICDGLPGPAARNMGLTITALKALGYSILFTERNPDFPTDVADRSYLLMHGYAEELDATAVMASVVPLNGSDASETAGIPLLTPAYAEPEALTDDFTRPLP
ncbi:ATP-binding cassette domain-containing protein [Bordetella sp. N]|uniref:ATP-binding cassette domain-containing protein n=1 Tax=Bordetella sp. N TaxID=1746199 RepID=UPI0009E8434A|nr:ATP-binding cassette domain-containing protein [Bordetella sp. N]